MNEKEKQKEFLKGLNIFRGNGWEFNDKMKRDLYQQFKDVPVEKWQRLCRTIYSEAEFMPKYATFIKYGYSTGILGNNKPEALRERKKTPVSKEFLDKLYKKSGLNLQAKQWPKEKGDKNGTK